MVDLDIQYNQECDRGEVLSDAGKQSSITKHVTRKVIAPRVKWTEQMERNVLGYIQYNFIDGKDFEKPSAPEYYRNFMKDAVGFSGVSLAKLVQHKKTLKKCYLSAIEWRNKTGQGVLDSQVEDGPATIETELLRRCKYCKELDEILGSKPQINPPYVHHTATSSISATPSFEELIEGQNVGNIEELDFGENIDQLMNEKSPERTKRPTPVKHSIILKRKFRSSPIKSAAGALESAMRGRIAAEEKRLTWEKECKANELDLNRTRLDFEREKWQREFEQKKEFEDKKYEIEKLKVEKDAELSKLKIEKEFELEKLRIQSMGK